MTTSFGFHSWLGLASSTLFLGLIGLCAIAEGGCSGAETQDVLTKASSSATTSGATSSSGTTSSGTSGTSSSGTSGTPGDCEQEAEPNDSKGQANTLNPSRCGTLSQRDQKDFLSFQLKPTTKTMQINFSGRVRLKVDVPGRESTELTPDNAGVVPFVMGVQYTIEVTALTSSSSDIPWRVTVVEK
jgi:hypothetical protein